MPDYYELLGVQPTATEAEIHEAYMKARARLLAEADEGESAEEVSEAGMDPEAQEEAQAALEGQLEALDAAYATLVQPGRRTAYDRAASEPAHELMKTSPRRSSPHPETPVAPVPQQVCPYCGELSPAKATQCLHCGQQISRPCPQCGFNVTLDEQVCPRCQTVIAEYDRRRYADVVVVEKRIQEERRSSEARVRAMEAVYRAQARLGVLFFLIAGLVILGMCVGLALLYSYLVQNAIF